MSVYSYQIDALSQVAVFDFLSGNSVDFDRAVGVNNHNLSVERVGKHLDGRFYRTCSHFGAEIVQPGIARENQVPVKGLR